MNCPHCDSNNTRQLNKKTMLGYQRFFCSSCQSEFNERTGTKLNYIEYPTDVVMLVIHYYYRFKVSLDDVVELMAMRNIFLSHQTVHNWVQTFGVELGIQCQKKRKGKAGKKWHADATYVCIKGDWCYLYRAIDKEGNLVDVYLSETRDQEAAENFFAQAMQTTGVSPTQVTTDKEPALYPAIETIFDKSTKHRDSKYMNNRIEQNHRAIKSRYRPMKGFKDFFSGLIFCTAFEEIRQFFRMENKTRAQRRKIIPSKISCFQQLLAKTA